MSNKRKLASILGICGATVLASGGTVFLTNTGMSLADKSQQTVAETELPTQTAETEQLDPVEQFTKTKDSFVVSAKTADKTPGSSTAKEPDGTTADANTMYATGNVRVRGGAGTDSDVLATLSVGDAVTVTGNRDGEWVEVTYNGQTGYISGNYLSNSQSGGTSSGSGSNTGSTSSQSGSNTGSSSGSGSSGSGSSGTGSSGGSTVVDWTVTPEGGTMYATGNVNVRDGASTNYAVLGTLSVGEAIAITGSTSNGWIQVSYNGQTGYVANNYLSWDQPSSNSGGNSSAWDDSYYMYDSDSRYLSAEELSDWGPNDLAILRNEIFARHGRIFQKQKWRDYFSQKTWYVPRYDNVEGQLNEIEWANLDLIMKLEEQFY